MRQRPILGGFTLNSNPLLALLNIIERTATKLHVPCIVLRFSACCRHGVISVPSQTASARERMGSVQGQMLSDTPGLRPNIFLATFSCLLRVPFGLVL